MPTLLSRLFNIDEEIYYESKRGTIISESKMITIKLHHISYKGNNMYKKPS